MLLVLPDALSGPARVAINGNQASRASYRVENDALVIEAVFASGKGQTIRISPGGTKSRETYLDLSGTYDYEVHLAPT